MPIVKDLEVRVVKAEGHSHFEEYALIHKKDTNKATCFIESEDGGCFDILFHPLQNFPMAKYPVNPENYPGYEIPESYNFPWLWNAQVTVDGADHPQVRRIFTSNPCNPDGTFICFVCPRIPMPGGPANMYSNSHWAFTDVAKTAAGLNSAFDGMSFDKSVNGIQMNMADLQNAFDQSSMDKSAEENTKLGSIRVDIYRKLKKGLRNYAIIDNLSDTMDIEHEVDRHVTHVVQAVNTTPAENDYFASHTWLTHPLDQDDAPFATFVFYYRSAEKLVQFGVKEATKGRFTDTPKKTANKRVASQLDLDQESPPLTRSLPIRTRAISKDHHADQLQQGLPRRNTIATRATAAQVLRLDLHRSNAVIHKPSLSSKPLAKRLIPPPLPADEAIQFAQAMPHSDRAFTFRFGPPRTTTDTSTNDAAERDNKDKRKSKFLEEMLEEVEPESASSGWRGAVELGAKKLISRGKVRIVEEVAKYKPRQVRQPFSDEDSDEDGGMDTD